MMMVTQAKEPEYFGNDVFRKLDAKTEASCSYLDQNSRSEIRARRVLLEGMAQLGLPENVIRKWLVFAQGHYAKLLFIMESENVLLSAIVR